MRWYPIRDQRLFHHMGHHIKAILQADCQQRVYTGREYTGNLLTADHPLVQEVWSWIKGWYNEANNYNPLPTCITIERIMAERVAL